MIRIHRRAAWGLLGALLAGCSGGESLPPGPILVRQAAREMASVRTLSFSFEVEGELGLLLIRRAEGSMTREGDAAGSVLLEQGQTLVEYEVVVSNGTYYLKGPTGGWTTIPEGLASGISDPTRLLDPEGGLASILEEVRSARTEEAGDAAGIPAYLVRGQIPAGPLRQFLPLAPAQEFVDGTLWIGRDRPVLLRAEIQAPSGPGRSDAARLSIALGDFNEPVSVTPPA